MNSKEISLIKQSVQEITALDEIYSDIISSKINNSSELELKQEEAKFARNRILKLSLNLKNIIEK